jgi:hypothetical protein
MSSGPVGKFQDHYKVFGVDPKASTDEIHAAYRKQIELYHPERGKSPDREKYEAAQLAFEVLSDPEGRKTFDSVRSGGEDEAECSFSGISFFTDMRYDVDRRNVILIALYDHKRQKPRTPAITRRQLDMIISIGDDDLQLAIWYLKDRGLMIVDDRSKMQITAAGMDYLQQNLPAIESVLPFLKLKKGDAEALASATPVPTHTTSADVSPTPAPSPPVAPPSPPAPLNLMPMTNLANLAASVANATEEAKPAAEPVGVTFEASKPRPLNIVRRPLKLN